MGAAIGTVAGPVGTGIGMAAGAIAGGLAGKGIAEKIDPTAEDAYWRTSYISRSYVDKDTPYDLYQSAYRTGYEGYGRYRARASTRSKPICVGTTKRRGAPQGSTGTRQNTPRETPGCVLKTGRSKTLNLRSE